MTDRKPFDDREANLEAAGAFMTMMGGFENMVAQGIHLADLAPIVDPDPSIDLTSLYQLREIADMQRQRRALRVGPLISSHEVHMKTRKSRLLNRGLPDIG